MTISFFQNATRKEMSRIRNTYSLKEIIECEVVKYQGDCVTLIIALDHFFEISICLYSNIDSNKRIYLESFMEYSGYQTEEIAIVNRNQHDKHTLENFLQKISPIVDDMLSKIIIDYGVFEDCYRFTTMRDTAMYQNRVMQETKRILNTEWKKGDYHAFLKLYEEHKACLFNDMVLKQKALYASKIINIGDGLRDKETNFPS